MLRLRRVNRLCSRTVSSTANMSGYGSTLCSPTEEKILCRFPISQRSHVGNLRQTIQGKGRSPKRKGNRRCPFLFAPAAGAATSRRRQTANPLAEVQRKTLRPSGANTLTQFASPAQSVQKRLPPRSGEPPARFKFPAQPMLKKVPPGQGEPACGSSRAPVNPCREI